MSGITGIIFDKDGTLFDFAATWSGWSRTVLLDLAGGDRAGAARLGAVIGFDFERGRFAADSPVIAETVDCVAERLLPHLNGTGFAPLVARLNAAAAEAAMVEAVPLVPFFDDLTSRNLFLGLATNDSEVAAQAHLAAAGVGSAFDFVAGYDSGFGAKPGPGMLRAFAERFGLAPDEVAMVGDSAHDLLAARAAGMRPVAVLTGIATADELAALAEVVLPDIGHLPGWIEARSAG